MIKAEDLRIGDLVRYGKDVISIQAVHTNYEEGFIKDKYNVGYNCDELDPIPLNPEILEKNGWKKKREGWYVKNIDKYDYMSVEFEYEDGIRVFLKRAVNGHYAKLNVANNVHELQHILWALGKDANLKV